MDDEPHASLIKAGVVERLPDGRLRLTQSAWENMTTLPAHSAPQPSQPPNNTNRSAKRAKY
jgi:hypothetical protein